MTLSEVFIRTHTKKDGTFVDMKAQEVVEVYRRNKQSKLDDLEAENADPSESSSQAPELSIDDANEIFLLVIFFS